MWSTLIKVVGSSVFKYAGTAIMGLLLTLGGLKIKDRYEELIVNEVEVEQLRVKYDGVLFQLESQAKMHEAETLRMESDRDLLDLRRLKVQKDAFAEAGRLNKQIEEFEDAKLWHGGDIPDSIRVLNEGVSGWAE